MSFPSWDIGKEEFPFRQLPPNTTKYILCGIISSEENTQHLHVSSLKMDNSYSRGWSIISKWRKTFQTLTSCFAWLTGDNLIIKFNTKFYSQNWSYYTWKCAECPEILKKKSFSTKKKMNLQWREVQEWQRFFYYRSGGHFDYFQTFLPVLHKEIISEQTMDYNINHLTFDQFWKY